MLKGLDPLLHADLLHILCAMGHGDELVLVDTNFPAAAMGRRVVRLDGVSGPRALEAILSVFPLDDFVEMPAVRMEMAADPEAEPPVCREFADVIARSEGLHHRLGRIDRQGFYQRARSAFAIVVTGETRLYGCLLLAKGVIRPEVEG